jgi:hypothetical protein
MTTAVYIDAFNLYYGSLKGTDCKWLDISKLMSLVLPNQDITVIRYFTAKISAKPHDPAAPLRQQAYLSALETLNNVTIHYGRYQTNTVKMPLANPARGQTRMVEVIKSEEKGSDVNLATRLLVDAFAQLADSYVVVSNDADLAEPLRVVCHDLNLKVGIYNPHPPATKSYALGRINPTFHRDLRRGVIKASQFPASISHGSSIINKPSDWA